MSDAYEVVLLDHAALREIYYAYGAAENYLNQHLADGQDGASPALKFVRAERARIHWRMKEAEGRDDFVYEYDLIDRLKPKEDDDADEL